MKIELNHCYNMDCIEGMLLMEQQGIKADCLLTDLPYGEVNRESNGLRNLDKAQADSATFDLNTYLRQAVKVVNGNFLIFCGTEQVSDIRKFFVTQGMTMRLLIWEKTNPSPMNGKTVYLSGIECCVYAKSRGGGVQRVLQKHGIPLSVRRERNSSDDEAVAFVVRTSARQHERGATRT